MVDFDADAETRRAGWNGFVKATTYSSAAIALVLVLMAIFLL